MSKPHRGRSSVPSFLAGEQRINKLLAAAGLGSRRQVDELITEGRVEVDGKIIDKVGLKVQVDTAKILVDGEPLKRHRPVYYAVHKPSGFLCTNADPEGRPRVIDLVPSHTRLFPVGRLDASSTGLILLTNDGELAQRLAHPKHCVPKSYFVVVAGQVDRESLKRLQRGIYLSEGIARVDGATIKKVRKGCTEIQITLSEGKNREIRRVLARLGHKVVVLRRVSIASLKLADLPEGAYRQLSDNEVAGLYQFVEELKSARNQERRERKRRSQNRNQAPRELAPDQRDPRFDGKSDARRSNHSKTNSLGSKHRGRKGETVQVPIPFDEEENEWDSDERFHTDEMLDSLPSIADNPYRMADDTDSDELEGLDDAILVKDHGDSFDTEFEPSWRQGAVLGFEDESTIENRGRPARPYLSRSRQSRKPRQTSRDPKSSTPRRDRNRKSPPFDSRGSRENRQPASRAAVFNGESFRSQGPSRKTKKVDRPKSRSRSQEFREGLAKSSRSGGSRFGSRKSKPRTGISRSKGPRSRRP